jgi:putative spermidine/putrescine transport system permease protein
VTLLIQSAGVEFAPPARDSLIALVITYEHANIPLFVLLMVPAMGTLREEWWEAAQASSATRLQFWRRVGLPLLTPFLAAGFVLSFTWSIGIFGIAYALAGQSAALPIQLITLQIGQALYDDAIRGPERAAVLSVLLMVLAIGALLLYRALLRRGTRWLIAGTGPLAAQHGGGRRPLGGRLGRVASLLLFGGFALYLFVPIAAVLLYSVAGRWTANVLPDTYTLEHWVEALAGSRIAGAFWTSLTLGFWTTLIVLALTVPAAYWARVRNPRIRPVLELSAAVPFALPFVVVGFALLHFTGTVFPPLQGSYVLVVLAYVAVSFPFVYWALDGALAAADVRRLSEAAAAAGASSWQTIWRVVLPNIRAGLATAAMLAFALAIGEFALVKMLAGSLNTIPLLSATMMNASGGSFAPLAVMTTIVFVMLFVISVAVAWLNRDRLTSTYAGPGT